MECPAPQVVNSIDPNALNALLRSLAATVKDQAKRLAMLEVGGQRRWCKLDPYSLSLKAPSRFFHKL